MKKMHEFREWLYVPNQISTTVQNRLAVLTSFSHKQVNSLASFEPWYLWQADNSVA